MTDIVKAMAEVDQPLATFKAMEALVRETIGVQLFTLTQIDQSAGVASRIYTTLPDAYPVHGQKQIEPNTWTETVLERHDTFVANTISDIATVFPDHALIKSLGYGSCVNIPVIIAGKVVGTLNCLHATGHYTPRRVLASEALKPAGALTFLLYAFQANDA
ncbi:hypothetical protein A8B78_02680 [Jannaschia sp. EhC01]|nr:hypothetical protein A8B78_02680 [Jannaschia sp. EhC01]